MEKSFENGTLRFLLIRIITIVQHLLCAEGIVIHIPHHFLISILGQIHEISMLIPCLGTETKPKKSREALCASSHSE